ncbi:hypothetical protein [Sphingomonas sp. M1-B02]|uniref:hypothetical protein n=1 Tax=Sphingomonas sp. M1-B02 TaxID=3114300 RepID=UPI00223EF25D|nr:hypothetical protein [Sphingomonas sp. S6-11]UZK65909.1 hypothetical protein OKW87_15580 [Sphingomonas sp. S6-11]
MRPGAMRRGGGFRAQRRGETRLVKVLAAQLDPDTGSVDMPRGARLGYSAKEAPHGECTLSSFGRKMMSTDRRMRIALIE